MASRPDHQSLPGTTALAGFDPIIFAFIDDLRVREGIAAKHVGRFRGTARPSIEGKRVTPHVLRHFTAMTILHATGDIRKVSLWLGHADIKTTEAYLRASPAEKLRILETNVPPSIRPGTFPGATDSLMRVLGGRGRLELMPSESGE